MSYEIHISRAIDPEADDGGIPADEWAGVVAEDPSLSESRSSSCDQKSPNGSQESVAVVTWSGHLEGTPVAFWFDDGRVRTKYPDGVVAAKMVEIARKLDARVFDDDGDEYDLNARGALTGGDGETTVRNDASLATRAAPWIAILVIIAAVIGAMAWAARY